MSGRHYIRNRILQLLSKQDDTPFYCVPVRRQNRMAAQFEALEPRQLLSASPIELGDVTTVSNSNLAAFQSHDFSSSDSGLQISGDQSFTCNTSLVTSSTTLTFDNFKLCGDGNAATKDVFTLKTAGNVIFNNQVEFGGSGLDSINIEANSITYNGVVMLDGKLTINALGDVLFSEGSGLYAAAGKSGQLELTSADELTMAAKSFMGQNSGGSEGLLSSVAMTAHTISLSGDIDLTSGQQRGDLSLTASDSAGQLPLLAGSPVHFAKSAASVTLNGATLTAGSVFINASSSATTAVEMFSLADVTGNYSYSSIDSALKTLTGYTDGKAWDLVSTAVTPSFPVYVSYVAAHADVNLTGSTTINASQDLSIKVQSKVTAPEDIQFDRFGIFVGLTDSDANLNVGSAVKLNAGQDIKLDALSVNDSPSHLVISNEAELAKSALASKAPSARDQDYSSAKTSTTIALSHKQSDAQSTILVTKGAQLSAGRDVLLTSRTENDTRHLVEASSDYVGKYGVNLANAVGNTGATVTMNGTIAANGAVLVRSDVADLNGVSASTELSSTTSRIPNQYTKLRKLVALQETPLVNVSGMWSDFLLKSMAKVAPELANAKIALGINAAVLTQSTRADALIGEGASIEAKGARASGNGLATGAVVIQANTDAMPLLVSTAGASKQGLVAMIGNKVSAQKTGLIYQTNPEVRNNAIALAVGVATLSNKATAEVGKEAQIRSVKALDVKADTRYHQAISDEPLVDWDNQLTALADKGSWMGDLDFLRDWDESLSNSDVVAKPNEWVNGLEDVMQIGDLKLLNLHGGKMGLNATSFVKSSASEGVKNSVAGSIAVMTMGNESTARIDEGAVIIQHSALSDNAFLGDKVTFNYAHGFAVGDKLSYAVDDQLSASQIGGLDPARQYYVTWVSQDGKGLSLAATPGGTPILFTAPTSASGVAQHRLDKATTAQEFATDDVSLGRSTILDLGHAHGFATGDRVVYTGDHIYGLTSGKTYTLYVTGISSFALKEVQTDSTKSNYGQEMGGFILMAEDGSGSSDTTEFKQVFLAGHRVELSGAQLGSLNQGKNAAAQGLSLGEGHGLRQGDIVTYSLVDGATAISGLQAGSSYRVYLSATGQVGLVLLDTLGKEAANFVTYDQNKLPGANALGSHIFTVSSVANGAVALSQAAVNQSSNGLFLGEHAYQTGDEVTLALYDAKGSMAVGSVVGTLTAGGKYYVIRSSEVGIQLAATLADAKAGMSLDLSVLSANPEIVGQLSQAPEAVAISNGKIAAKQPIATGDVVNFNGQQYVVAVGTDGQIHFFADRDAFGANEELATLSAATGTLQVVHDADLISAEHLALWKSAIGLGYPHGLNTGDQLVAQPASDSPLTAGKTYYVQYLDQSHFALAASQEDLLAGRFVDFSGVSTPFSLNLTPAQSMLTLTVTSKDLAATGRTLTLANAGSGLTTGRAVTVSSDHRLPGLKSDEIYYVVRDPQGQVQLAASYQDALAGRVIANAGRFAYPGKITLTEYRQDGVRVAASTHNDTLHVAGNLGLVGGLLSPSGTTGAGGAVQSLWFTNTNTALVAGKSQITADNLQVDAQTHNTILSLTQAGGQGKEKGYTGVLGLMVFDNTTLAQVQNGSTLTIGNNAHGSSSGLQIAATDDTNFYQFSLGLALSGKSAIGAGSLIQVVHRDTQAVLGALAGSGVTSAEGSVSVLGETQVKADNSGTGVTFLVGGTKATAESIMPPSSKAQDEKNKANSSSAADRQDVTNLEQVASLAPTAQSSPQGKDLTSKATSANKDAWDALAEKQNSLNNKVQDKDGGKPGTTVVSGVTAELGVYFSDESAKAYVANLASLVTAGLAVEARNRSNRVMVAGALAMTSNSTNQDSKALAGSALINVALHETAAYVEQVTLLQSKGNLQLNAEESGRQVQVAAGLAGSMSGKGVGGTLLVNVATANTLACVKGVGSLSVSGNMAINAFNDTHLILVAGGGGYGAAKGIGLSFGVNVLQADTQAYLQQSHFDVTGALSVTATSGKSQAPITGSAEERALAAASQTLGDNNDYNLIVVGASAGIAENVGNTTGGALGVAASMLVNVLNSSTQAYIADCETVENTLGGELVVQSMDRFGILSVAGSLAVTKSNSAGAKESTTVGSALAVNYIGSSSDAHLIRVKLKQSGQGKVTVEGVSQQSILAVTAAASLAVGSSNSNSITMAANALAVASRAFIDDSQLTLGEISDQKAGLLRVRAANESTILSVAGSVAISTAGTQSNAAALAINVASTRAELPDLAPDNGVETAKTLSPDLTSEGVTAYIQHSQVTLNGSVDSLLEVLAETSASILSIAAGIGAGGGGSASGSTQSNWALSGSAGVNVLSRQVSASLQGSTLVTAGKLSVVARDYLLKSGEKKQSSILAVTGSSNVSLAGNSAKGTSSLGAAVSVNVIDASVKSRIESSDLTLGAGLTLQAESVADLLAITAALAYNGNGNSLNGALAINIIDKVCEATVVGADAQHHAQVRVTGPLTILASDASNILAIAVAAGVSSSTAQSARSSGSLALGLNLIQSEQKVTLQHADLLLTGTSTAPASATIQALSRSAIQAFNLSLSGSIGSKSNAVAFSAIPNVISNHTQIIQSDASLTTVGAGDVTLEASQQALASNKSKGWLNGLLSAEDMALVEEQGDAAKADWNANILNVGMTLSGSTQGSSGGAIVAVNVVDSEVAIDLDTPPGSGKFFDVAGNLNLSATNQSVINAITVGAAASKSTTLEAGLNVNTVTGDTRISVAGAAGAQIHATGNSTIAAHNSSKIAALALSLGIGKENAVAVTGAGNGIAGDTRVTISNTDLDVTGATRVQALADREITALGLALAIAPKNFGGGLFLGANVIKGDTEVLISGSTGRAITLSGGSLSVLAEESSRINSLAIGIGAGSSAGGATTVTSVIHGDVTAKLEEISSIHYDTPSKLDGSTLSVSALGGSQVLSLAVGAGIATKSGAGAAASTQNILVRDVTALVAMSASASNSLYSAGDVRIEAMESTPGQVKWYENQWLNSTVRDGVLEQKAGLASTSGNENAPRQFDNDQMFNASGSLLGIAVSLAGAFGGSGSAGAGTLVVNTLSRHLAAQLLADTTTMTVGGDLLVTAQGESAATAIAFAGAGAGSNAGAGVVALNVLENSVLADVDLRGGSTLQVGGIQIHALNHGGALAAAGAVAGGGSNTGAGTLALNLALTGTLPDSSQQSADEQLASSQLDAEQRANGVLESGADAYTAPSAQPSRGEHTIARLWSSDRAAQATIHASGLVSVTTESGTSLMAIALAAAGGKSNSGAGALTLNLLDSKADAFISNVTVLPTNSGDNTRYQVTANRAGAAWSFIIAAAGSGSNAGGGALSFNLVSGAVSAFVEHASLSSNGTALLADSGLKIAAEGQTDILTAALAAAGSGKAAGAGAVAINLSGNLVSARLEQSNIALLGSAGQKVSVTADDRSSIFTIAVAAAGAGKGAGAGILALNLGVWDELPTYTALYSREKSAEETLLDAGGSSGGFTTQALVSDSQLQLGGSLSVSADNRSAYVVSALAGAGAGTGAGAGIFAMNLLDAKALASVQLKDNSQGIKLEGALNIEAINQTQMLALLATLVGAGQGAGGASVALNVADLSALALLTGPALDADKSVSANGIKVSAQSAADVSIIAGVIAGAGVGAGVAGVAVNAVSNSTAAEILGVGAANAFLVNAGSGGVDVTASNQTKLSAIAGGIAGGGTGAGGGTLALNLSEKGSLSGLNMAALNGPASGVAGLSESTTYQVTVLDGDTIQLRDAKSGALVDLLAGTPAGRTFYLKVRDSKTGAERLLTFTSADINAELNTLHLAQHGLAGEDSVAYSSSEKGYPLIVSETLAEVKSARAAIANATVTASQAITVNASSKRYSQALAAGVAGAGTGAGYGSLALNISNNETSAEILASSLAASAITATALDQGATLNVAGAAALGLAGGSGAASVAVNVEGGNTLARVAGSTLTASSGDIKVDATRQNNVGALALSAAGGLYFAASGSVSVNHIKGATQALINASTLDAKQGNISVTANFTPLSQLTQVTAPVVSTQGGSYSGAALKPQSELTSAFSAINDTLTMVTGDSSALLPGGIFGMTITFAAGAGAIGGAVSVNTISGALTAQSDSLSLLRAAQDVKIASQLETGITSWVAGGSGGLIGVTGAVAVNTIDMQQSSLLDNSQVAAGGALKVTAERQSNSEAKVLSVSAGGVALSFGVVSNVNSSDISATIRNSQSVQAKSVLVDVEREDLLGSTVIGEGFSTAFGLNGGLTFNTLRGAVTAAVENSTLTLSGGELTVNAHDTSGIKADSLQVAASGMAALSVLTSFNSLTSNVSAALTGSTVSSASKVNVTASVDPKAGYNEIRSLGLTVGGNLAAGAVVSKLVIGGNLSASLSNSTLNNIDAVTVSTDGQWQASVASMAGAGGVAAGVGSASLITLDATQSSTVSDLVLNQVKSLSVLANATPDLYAYNLAATVSALGVGVAVADITMSPKVSAVLGNLTVAAGLPAIRVEAMLLRPAERDLTGVGKTQASAVAAAVAPSAGVLAGVGGAVSTLSGTSQVTAEFNASQGVTLGSLTVKAKDQTQLDARPSAAGVGLVVGIGVAKAVIDHGSQTSGKITVSGDLVVSGAVDLNAANQLATYTEPKAGAGALGVAVAAAISEVNLSGKATAQVTGNIRSQGDHISLHSDNTLSYHTQLDTFAASLANGSGADSSNTITAEAQTLISDRAQLTAAVLDIGSQNSVLQGSEVANAFGESVANGVKSTGYGLLTVNAGGSEDTLTVTATTTVGQGAKLLATGQELSANALALSVTAFNKLNVHDYVYFKSGSAIGVPVVGGTITSHSRALVAIGQDAQLRTLGVAGNTLHLQAASSENLVMEVGASVYGVASAGKVSGDVNATTDNQITIAQNGQLYSTGALVVAAGYADYAYDWANMGDMKFEGIATILDKTAVPASDASGYTNWAGHHKLDLAAGALLQARGNVYLTASERNTDVSSQSVAENWLSSDNIKVGKAGRADQSLDNKLTLNGRVQSGVDSAIDVVINNLDRSYWENNQNNRALISQSEFNRIQGALTQISTMTGKSWWELQSDLVAGQALISTRSANWSSEQLKSFTSALSNLSFIVTGSNVDLLTIGLHDFAGQADANLAYYLQLKEQAYRFSGTAVATAMQPELTRVEEYLISKGLGERKDGVFHTTYSQGTGIDIGNATVRKGDIQIQALALEGTGSLQADGGAAIRIQQKTNNSLYAHDLTIAADGSGGSLYLNNVRMTATSSEALLQAMNGKTNSHAGFTNLVTSAMQQSSNSNELSILQQDSALNGGQRLQIAGTISNMLGKVTIHAANDLAVTGSVVGQTMDVSAKGAITMILDSSFYNVGGLPAGVDTLNGEPKLLSPGGRLVTLGDITIKAKTLNVNGLIQSGVKNYNAKLTDWDSLFSFMPYYKASRATEMVLDAASGVMTAKIGYNLVNGTVYLDDVRASQGGKITIEADQILNTNSGLGKIVAFTNPDINIQFKQSVVAGLIDTGPANRAPEVNIKEGDRNKVSFSNSGTYTPQNAKDIKFHYVFSLAKVKRTSYDKTFRDFSLGGWSWFDLSTIDLGAPVSVQPVGDWKPDGDGAFFGAPYTVNKESVGADVTTKAISGNGASGNIYTYTQDVAKPIIKVYTNSWREGFIFYVNYTRVQRTEDQGQKEFRWYQLDANKDISVTLGQGSGKVQLQSSAGSVALKDNVKASGTLDISAAGNITAAEQAVVTSLGGQSITLNANGELGRSDQVVQVSSTGKVVVSANNSYLKGMTGLDLQVNRSSTLNVLTTGDLKLQSAATYHNLISQTGGITLSSSSPEAVYLSAQAATDIQVEGKADLYLGSLVSSGGNVAVSTQGSILDNNYIQSLDQADVARMQALWDKMGVVQSDASSQQAQIDTMAQQWQNQMAQAYRNYWQLLAQLGMSSDEVSSVADDDSRLVQLGQQQGSTPAVLLQNLRSWREQLAGYDASLVAGSQDGSQSQSFTLSAEQKLARFGGLFWSKEDLTKNLIGVDPSKSVSSGAETGTTTTFYNEQANVVGDEILLQAGQHVGALRDHYVWFSSEELKPANFNQLSVEKKIAIWSAELGDLVQLPDGSGYVMLSSDLNVRAREGISAYAKGNLLLGGGVEGNDFNQDQTLRLNSLVAGGEIRIKSNNDLLLTGSGANFNGSQYGAGVNSLGLQEQNVVLESSNGSLGTAQQALLVNNQQGKLALTLRSGRAGGDVAQGNGYLTVQGDLLLNNIQADGKIVVEASGAVLQGRTPLTPDELRKLYAIQSNELVVTAASGDIRLHLGNKRAETHLSALGDKSRITLWLDDSTAIKGSLQAEQLQLAAKNMVLADDELQLQADSSTLTGESVSLSKQTLGYLNSGRVQQHQLQLSGGVSGSEAGRMELAQLRGENITASGSAGDDHFVLDLDTQHPQQAMNHISLQGQGGNDTLDYSATLGSSTLTLSTLGGGALQGAALQADFSGIEQILASATVSNRVNLQQEGSVASLTLGSADDAVLVSGGFSGTPARLANQIVGAGGADTLSFTGFTSQETLAVSLQDKASGLLTLGGAALLGINSFETIDGSSGSFGAVELALSAQAEFDLLSFTSAQVASYRVTEAQGAHINTLSLGAGAIDNFQVAGAIGRLDTAANQLPARQSYTVMATGSVGEWHLRSGAASAMADSLQIEGEVASLFVEGLSQLSDQIIIKNQGHVGMLTTANQAEVVVTADAGWQRTVGQHSIDTLQASTLAPTKLIHDVAETSEWTISGDHAGKLAGVVGRFSGVTALEDRQGDKTLHLAGTMEQVRLSGGHTRLILQDSPLELDPTSQLWVPAAVGITQLDSSATTLSVGSAKQAGSTFVVDQNDAVLADGLRFTQVAELFSLGGGQFDYQIQAHLGLVTGGEGEDRIQLAVLGEIDHFATGLGDDSLTLAADYQGLGRSQGDLGAGVNRVINQLTADQQFAIQADHQVIATWQASGLSLGSLQVEGVAELQGGNGNNHYLLDAKFDSLVAGSGRDRFTLTQQGYLTTLQAGEGMDMLDLQIATTTHALALTLSGHGSGSVQLSGPLASETHLGFAGLESVSGGKSQFASVDLQVQQGSSLQQLDFGQIDNLGAYQLTQAKQSELGALTLGQAEQAKLELAGQLGQLVVADQRQGGSYHLATTGSVALMQSRAGAAANAKADTYLVEGRIDALQILSRAQEDDRIEIRQPGSIGTIESANSAHLVLSGHQAQVKGSAGHQVKDAAVVTQAQPLSLERFSSSNERVSTLEYQGDADLVWQITGDRSGTLQGIVGHFSNVGHIENLNTNNQLDLAGYLDSVSFGQGDDTLVMQDAAADGVSHSGLGQFDFGSGRFLVGSARSAGSHFVVDGDRTVQLDGRERFTQVDGLIGMADANHSFEIGGRMDSLVTGAGDDYIVLTSAGSLGQLQAGAGNDQLVVAADHQGQGWQQADLGEGDNRFQNDLVADQHYTVTGDARLDLLLGQQTLTVSGVQHLISGKGNDTIVVAGHLDTISAGVGNDTILLKDGSSSHLLDGGEGANLLQNDRTQGKTNWHVLTRSGSLTGVDQFANIGATVDNSVGALYLLAGSMDSLVFGKGPSVLIRTAGGHTGSVDMGNYANRFIDAETGAGSGTQARTPSRSAMADLGRGNQATSAATSKATTLLTASDADTLPSDEAVTSRQGTSSYAGQVLRSYADSGQTVLTASGAAERIPDPINTGSASNTGGKLKSKVKKAQVEEQSQAVKHPASAHSAPAQQQKPQPEKKQQTEAKPTSNKGEAAVAPAPENQKEGGSQPNKK